MNSLRAQLTVRLLLGGALLLAGAGIALHWQAARTLTREFDAALQTSTQSLSTLTEQEDGVIRMEFAGADMPQFGRADGPDVFMLSTPKGRAIARSPSLGAASLPLRAGTAGAPEFFDAILPDGRVLRCAGIRFSPQIDDGRQGRTREAVLVVGRPRAPLDRALAALRNSLLWIGILALAALVMVVRWGVNSSLAPLDQLGARIATVNAASLSTRFPVEPLPLELRPMAARLNELLARLADSFARERRFTATAAHELRTPLAELRALAEVNLSTPATGPERAESWRDALATTLRMESLSLRLLDLARAEDAALVLHRESVALADAIAAAWQPWTARANARGITLDLELPPALTALTDAALLGVILENLCANAAEHAPAGTPFRIRAGDSSEAVTLVFQNRNDGITAADLSQIFEKFWRKDPSRSDGRHHGLGLSLAAELAALLGGTLTARLDADGDLEFTLRLPASAPA